MLQSMGLQRVGHNLATEQQQQIVNTFAIVILFSLFALGGGWSLFTKNLRHHTAHHEVLPF